MGGRRQVSPDAVGHGGRAAGRFGPRPGGQPIPLRPQTLGELLDSATGLLRGRAGTLLAISAALSVSEQALLYPLRRAAGLVPPWFFPSHASGFQAFYLLISLGLGTEAVIIALLGGLAARAAVPALAANPGSVSGTSGPRPRAPGPAPGDPGPLGARPPAARRSRAGASLVVALLTGSVSTVLALFGLVGWPFWYMFTGLAAPALIIDGLGPGRALLRSVRLNGWGGGRPGGIRLLGYLAWYAIRLALGVGGVFALRLVTDLPASLDWLISALLWASANTVAYAALGCLDAVLHLENRMRVEGLDIALSRALRRGLPVESVLAVPR